MACECAQNWRLDLVFWGTGETLATIVPESFEFQSVYQEHGNASVRFNMRGVTPPQNEINNNGWFRVNGIENLFTAYPGDCGIVIQRVAGGAASFEDPIVMFAGIIETLRVSSSGDIDVGLVEITEYLERRVLRNTATFSSELQTVIAASLVNYALFGNFNFPPSGAAIDTEWEVDRNVQLSGDVVTSSITRDRTYEAADRPTIWELLKNLMQISDGPEYSLSASRGTDGNWAVSMTFNDPGPPSGTVPTIHWAEVVDAELTLERRERTTLIEVFGRDGLLVTRTLLDADVDLAFFQDGRFIRHDDTRTYDAITTSALNDWGDGYVIDHYDPASFLRLSFAGVQYSEVLSLDDFVPGDPVNVRLPARVGDPPWLFVGGPDILAGSSPDVAADDMQFGTVSVSVPNEGPERVTVEVTTAKTILPVRFGEVSP